MPSVHTMPMRKRSMAIRAPAASSRTAGFSLLHRGMSTWIKMHHRDLTSEAAKTQPSDLRPHPGGLREADAWDGGDIDRFGYQEPASLTSVRCNVCACAKRWLTSSHCTLAKNASM